MPIVNNPQTYDDKEPTNVRIVKALKNEARADALARGVHLSDIINELLREKYEKHD